MQVFLETSDVVIPRNEGQALSLRFRDAFARLAGRIHGLHVSFRDVNGPRGGRDKLCVIRVELAKGGQVIVRERSASLGRAISRSIRRARVLVAHELKPRGSHQWQQLALRPMEATS